MSPGRYAAIVLSALERAGPSTPAAICAAMPEEYTPAIVAVSLYRLCRAGRARRGSDGVYFARRGPLVVSL